MDCYIVSTKHTKPEHEYITFWRPNNSGYAWPLSWAGKYSAADVQADSDYYNSRRVTIAVPCSVLDAIAVSPEPGVIDGNAGPVVLNDSDSWSLILSNQIRPQEAKQGEQAND